MFRCVYTQVSELCETGSEAWSVDVLASDTSERQSERLRELEQVGALERHVVSLIIMIAVSTVVPLLVATLKSDHPL